jgi:hypothetical protein
LPSKFSETVASQPTTAWCQWPRNRSKSSYKTFSKGWRLLQCASIVFLHQVFLYGRLLLWTFVTGMLVSPHCFIMSVKKLMAVVRKRIIPTERPPLFGEVSANLCG